MSVGDREHTKIWASRSATAVGRIARLISADVAAGHTPSSIDPENEAGRLFALVQGMSFQSLVDPAHWPPARLRNIVDLDVARLRSQGLAGKSGEDVGVSRRPRRGLRRDGAQHVDRVGRGDRTPP